MTPVKYVPLDMVRGSLRRLVVEEEKNTDFLKDLCLRHESRIAELEEETKLQRTLLEQKQKQEDALRKDLEREIKEKESYRILGNKTSDQLVQTMKRCPPIRIWVRLTHPKHDNIPDREKQSLEYDVIDGRSIRHEDKEYRYNRVFGLNDKTMTIFTSLKPFLDVVQADNRHLIIMAYGESGSGKSSTLLDGVPTGTGGKDAPLFKLIANHFLGAPLRTDEAAHKNKAGTATDAGAIARVSGYSYATKMVQRLNRNVMKEDQDDGKHNLTATVPKNKKDNAALQRPTICKSVDKLLQEVRELNHMRPRREMSVNSKSSRDHGWYHITFSKQSAQRGAVTIFDLAGLEEIGNSNDDATNREALNLINALNGLNQPLGYLGGGKVNEWDPTSRAPNPDPFVKHIADMLRGINRYSMYNRPYIVILGHVADTNGQEDKSRKVLERLHGWLDSAAEIEVDLDMVQKDVTTE